MPPKPRLWLHIVSSYWFKKFDAFFDARPNLARIFANYCDFHRNLSGYRQYGLFRGDIISDENPVVQEALSRLDEKTLFDRAFRIRRACQLSASNEVLPKEMWTKREEDLNYLTPTVHQVIQELRDKERLDKKDNPTDFLTEKQ